MARRPAGRQQDIGARPPILMQAAAGARRAACCYVGPVPSSPAAPHPSPSAGTTRGRSARPARGALLARVRRLAVRVGLWLLFLSVAEVLWVRFLPPLGTVTMAERSLAALFAGRSPALERRWVGRAAISDDLVRAVLAGEDAGFYHHHGFDLHEIREAWRDNHRPRNLRAGRIRGASTLTQQTARNLFLWQQRSWLRKGLEAWFTVLLELLLPKDRILVLYLNVAEWGDRVFGVEAAARHSFGVAARAVSREQAAALAASLPFPRRYPPESQARPKLHRQALILSRMDGIRPGERQAQGAAHRVPVEPAD